LSFLILFSIQTSFADTNNHDVCQHTLLSKIQNYFLDKNINKIVDIEGYCCGLSTVWLYSKGLQTQPKTSNGPRDDYDWFKSSTELITGWDEKRELKPEEAAELERFFSLIEHFQIMQGRLEHAQNNMCRELKTPIKQEYSIASLLTAAQLNILLTTENFIQDNKFILVSSENHFTALFKERENYYLFDPNSVIGEIKIGSTLEAAALIFSSHFFAATTGSFPQPADYTKSLPLSFQIFSSDETAAEYPIQKDVLAKIAPALDSNKDLANGASGLHMAAKIGCINSLEYLLEQGVPPDQRNNDGAIALMYAAQNWHAECIKTLIDNGAKPDQIYGNGWTTLMFAAQYGCVECIKILIDNRADPNQIYGDGWTALMFAAKNKRSECIEALIEKGAEPNKSDNDGWTALMIAAKNGHAECVGLLLEKGADPNQSMNDGWTALMSAAQNGHAECVKILLEKGAEPNKSDNDGWTALMIVAQNGNAECIEPLIKNKADPALLNNVGISALMIAAKNGQAKSIEALIENNVDPNQINDSGRTALIFAALNGRAECIKALFEKEGSKADPNKSQNDGTTALMCAAFQGYTECVKILLENGATYDQSRDDGWTAIMFAAKKLNVECIKALLDEGANQNKKVEVTSALEVAKSSGCEECIKILEEHQNKEIQHEDL
ncbi:MAG: ankyrin repeat domain-containing protein, partial [Gammaproteobacteria bacterium]|nr:ankyrin repeat domain-containing protein [Gammaproteobacteria bacterium]